MIRLIAFMTLIVCELSEVTFAVEPAGLPPIVYPKDNPPSDEKIALGKQLFFDGRLSADNKVACATCHDPAKGFSNGEFAKTQRGHSTFRAVIHTTRNKCLK